MSPKLKVQIVQSTKIKTCCGYKCVTMTDDLEFSRCSSPDCRDPQAASKPLRGAGSPGQGRSQAGSIVAAAGTVAQVPSNAMTVIWPCCASDTITVTRGDRQ